MDKSQAEILAILNLIPYLDAVIPVGDGITLGGISRKYKLCGDARF